MFSLSEMKDKETWESAFRALVIDKVRIAPQESVTQHVVDCLIATSMLVERQDKRGKRSVYIYHHDLGYFVPFASQIPYVASIAIRAIKREISLKTLSTNVILWINGGEAPIPPMNVPPYHVTLFENGPADMIENRLLSESEADTYHFTTRNPLRFGVEIDRISKLILDRMFDGWSDCNPEKKKVILHGLRNVIEVNSRNKILILIGKGGNGKSSYLKCARALAGEDHTIDLNLHQLKSTSNLNTVTESTTLMVGNEMQTAHRLKGETLTLCKMLATNDPITVPVKYQNDRVLYPRMCIIQASNTEVRFDEQTDALRDRMVYIHWTNTNFRELKDRGELDFDLDALLDDTHFLEQLLTYVLQETEYEERFIVPESMKQTMESQLEASDSVFQFYEYLHEMNLIDHNDVLITTGVYQLYKEWREVENPSGSTLAKPKLTERLLPYLERDGFTISTLDSGKVATHRVSSLKTKEWNTKQYESLIRKQIKLPQTSSVFKRTVSTFNEELANAIRKQEVIPDLDNPEHYRIVCHLIYDEKDTTMMSLYGAKIDSW